MSRKIKKAVLAQFQRQNLPAKYVYGYDDKEAIARAVAEELHITEGDVCALSVLEMAPTFRHERRTWWFGPGPA